MKLSRRIFAAILALAMLVSVVPAAPAAYAAEDTEQQAHDHSHDHGSEIPEDTGVPTEPEESEAPTEQEESEAPAEPEESEAPAEPEESEISAVPDKTDAGDIRLEGMCGDHISYTLTHDGTLTLIGELLPGQVYATNTYNYSETNKAPWAEAAADIRRIEIHQVYQLGDYLFHGLENVTDLYYDSYLRVIRHSAFKACRSLKTIGAPNNRVKHIYPEAFMDCVSLKSLSFSSHIRVIDIRAFAGCTGVENIYFADYCPNMGGANTEVFAQVTANVHYLYEEWNWRKYAGQNFGGDLTWIPFERNIDVLRTISNPTKRQYDIDYSLGYYPAEEADLTGLLLEVTTLDGDTYTVGPEDVTVMTEQIRLCKGELRLYCKGMQIYFDVWGTTIANRLVPWSAEVYNESPHEYYPNTDSTHIIHQEGALNLYLRFDAQSYVEEGFDKLRIYDGGDNLVAEFTGKIPTGDIKVPGDTAKIRLITDDSAECYGYKLIRITYDIFTEHDYYYQDGSPATCTQNGTTARRLCRGCGDVIEESEIIPPLGHDWDPGHVVVEADGTNPGVMERGCYRCNYSEQFEYPPDGIRARGTFGEENNLSWTLDATGTLTISGQGAMGSLMNGRPWKGWGNFIRCVQVEEGVTSIGDNAFSGMPYVTEISLPSTVTTIGESAFCDCRVLQEVTFLGGAPETIGDNIFGECGISNSLDKLNVTYPVGELSWNRDKMRAYGAYRIAWQPQGSISRLEIAQLPHRLSYIVGETVDFSGLLVDAVLPDGTVAQLSDTAIVKQHTPFDRAGIYDAWASMGELEVPFQITVHAEEAWMYIDHSLYPESPHHYANGQTDVQTIYCPLARRITVTFSQETSLQDGRDWLYVENGDGKVVAKFTGTQAAGRSVQVPGDTVQIRLEADESITDYGYSLDEVSSVGVSHQWQELSGGVENTCTGEGRSELLYCGICCLEYGGETLPALGHNWTESYISGMNKVHTCGRCGEIREESLDYNVYFTRNEWELLMQTNRVRFNNGVAPVTGYDVLQQAIREWFAISSETYFTDSLDLVLDEYSIYRNDTVDFNVYGSLTAAETVERWFVNKPENMLNSAFNHAGTASIPARNGWKLTLLANEKSEYTAMYLFFPNGKSLPVEAPLEDMQIYAVLESTACGVCFLPILPEYVSGYNPHASGDQEVTVNVLGFSESFTISRSDCDHRYVEEVIEPTCTEGGYIRYICTLCGNQTSGGRTEALGHLLGDEVIVEAPFCETPGILHKSCLRPGCGYVDVIYTDPLGHDWSIPDDPKMICMGGDYVCVCQRPGCGASSDASYWPQGHIWDDGVIILEPTNDAPGLRRYTCERCGEIRDEEIPVSDHQFVITVILPTCTEEGRTEYVCSLCGYGYTSDPVPALGHDLSQWAVTVEPGCETPGEEHTECDREGCGYEETREVAPLGHSYESVVTEPTCTEQGYTTHTCASCGHSYVDSETEALGHDLSQWAVTVEPGCETPGEEHTECVREGCGYEETREVAALGHDWDEGTVIREATETEPGLRRFLCRRCGETRDEEIPVCDHAFTSRITAPTCTTRGFTTYICAVCGCSYTDAHTEALGHDMSQWAVTVEPGCETPGEEHTECVREGCGYEETREVAPLGHSYESVVTEPTCTEQGYTTHTCASCGHSYVDSETEALGHDMGLWSTYRLPQCVAAGVERSNCSRCGYFETRATEALGHDYRSTACAPTCVQAGYTEHICSRCADTYVSDEVPALGHDYRTEISPADCEHGGYTTNICTRCQHSFVTDPVEALGHAWDEGVVVDSPARAANGMCLYACDRCEAQAEGSFRSTGGHNSGEQHEMGQWTVSQASTCDALGEQYRACAHCDYTEYRQIPYSGHKYRSEVTAPGCETGGHTVHTCADCGHSYETDRTEALGHEMTGWKMITAAVCENPGEEVRVCVRCGCTDGREIPAPGHRWNDPEAELRSCISCGYTDGGFPVQLSAAETGEGVSSVWVDGVEYPVIPNGSGFTVNLPTDTATNLVIYTMNDNATDDVHTQYPVSMKVWMLKYENGAYTAVYIPEFDNLLQYAGSSIRIVGVKGIRMITAIDKAVKTALTGQDGLAGYTLVEYGTALGWAADIDPALGLTLGQSYTKSNYAYKKGVADPVFKQTKDQIQYTNVLVGFDNDQCIPDIAMRPYIILEDAGGNQTTIYGGMIYRNIGYIAWQNRAAFKPGTAAYAYVWDIIHHVYGDRFDADYKK